MSINDDFVFFFSLVEIDWKQYSDGITMLLFQGDINYATGHGVVKLGDKVLLTTVKTKCCACPTEFCIICVL